MQVLRHVAAPQDLNPLSCEQCSYDAMGQHGWPDRPRTRLRYIRHTHEGFSLMGWLKDVRQHPQAEVVGTWGCAWRLVSGTPRNAASLADWSEAGTHSTRCRPPSCSCFAR